MDASVAVAFKEIKARRKTNIRFVLFKIDGITITVDKRGDRIKNYKDFIAQLPDTHPRFALYDYEFKTSDGRFSDRLYFCHWSPLNGNQQDRIRYAQALPSFRVSLPGTDHFSATAKEEFVELLKNEYNPSNPEAADGDSSEESEMSD